MLLQTVLEGASEFHQLTFLYVLFDPLVNRLGILPVGLVAHDVLKLLVVH